MQPPLLPGKMQHDDFVVPVSFAQLRLWFLDQLAPGSAAYNITRGYRMDGPLDIRVLEASLNAIVARHEVLRTRFAVVDSQPVQAIASELMLSVRMVDLTDIAEREKREDELHRLMTEESAEPFSLEHGPLLRAVLLRLEPEEHVLLLTIHHIASDAWSMGVMIRELSVLYAGIVSGKSSPLKTLPIQYADYAIWQREWLQGQELARQWGFWKEQLEGLASLHLPTDWPRPAEQSFSGALHRFLISGALMMELRGLAQSEGVTLYMLLLAAFQVLLSRYSGQSDIAVGSPIAGRNRTETEGLIGFFVNTLVMRTDLAGNPTFIQLLGRVRESCLGAYEHQDLPFEKLVEELAPQRDLSRNPLVQVSFALQNVPRADLQLPCLKVERLDVNNKTAKLDLALALTERDGQLDGVINYNTDLYAEETIERLVGHYRTLLEGIVTDPRRHISTLELLTAAEREQLLVEWNATKSDYPEDQCIHELFEAQVERTPDATALVFGEERLSYTELNQRANQLAHHLRGLGVGPEVVVGICVPRSLAMVIGTLAILKAGGAYVPLDPDYPQERLAFMLEDSGAPLLVTEASLLAQLPGYAGRTLCMDRDWAAVARSSSDNPVPHVSPDDLAYVIYTSGSTGLPKGVMVAHRGLCNTVAIQRRTFKCDVESRVLQFASQSFDASVFEILMALGAGGALCMVAPEVSIPGPALLRFLREVGVTILFLTPSTLAAVPVEPLPALQTIAVGGESCSAELVSRWAPGRRFFNLYGPTEATIWATMAEYVGGAGLPPIGRPISNTQIYILDPNLNPVPIGVPGELHIGGVGLARGYLNRPELTAEKFIHHPFKDDPGARIYKTGDLARYRPDGNIEFLGRIDHQVKVRGFRIEPGEIETVLARHPVVRETVVVVREDVPGERGLAAYIVVAGDSSATVGELRKFLLETLPEYMVPSTFVFLDTLPLTPNGKVDRRALPVPDGDRPAFAQPFVAPRTPVEELLAELWQSVLGIARVGIHDNFFTLGGHSLLAAQVASRLAAEFGIELPLRRVFEAPTIADLALDITAQLAEEVSE